MRMELTPQEKEEFQKKADAVKRRKGRPTKEDKKAIKYFLNIEGNGLRKVAQNHWLRLKALV